ncbi:MAG: DUF892 family protein [Nocardiopsaceae bacterium]|nr:DUF892 family protein [Nocardiopsaceae bacterium]
MAFNSPKDLFVHELSMMYDGEKKIAQMLDEIAGQVENQTLIQMLQTHKEETQHQAKNLEQCFQRIGESPRQVPCGVVKTIHNEFKEFVKQNPSSDVLTMFAISGATKTEHFEIATYRGLVCKAMLMGDAECTSLLEANLLQEEETASKLERFAHELGQQMLAPA